MVGDKFSTGGRALESNLVDKRLDFFRSFGEHIQEIGSRVIIHSTLYGAANSVRIYLVPPGKVAYLVYMNLSGYNSSATLSGAAKITISQPGSDPSVLKVDLPNTQTAPDSKVVSLANPLKFFAGEEFKLARTVASNLMKVSATMILYIVDKEVS